MVHRNIRSHGCSVFRGALHPIDHKDLHRGPHRFQFQTELIAQRRNRRRAERVGRIRRGRGGGFRRPRACGEEILKFCIDAGGSITGEHGVGMEKNELMSSLFTEDSLEMIRKLKMLFDPTNRLNPGKVLPTGRGCLEIRQAPLTPGAMVL